jgi:hypothetical protein
MGLFWWGQWWRVFDDLLIIWNIMVFYLEVAGYFTLKLLGILP